MTKTKTKTTKKTKTTTKTKRSSGARVPARLLAGIRRICRGLPGSVEAAAPIGARWQVRNRTFAHVVPIADGRPRAYAKAAGTQGPATVVTFRSSGFLYEALRAAGPPYFVAGSRTSWGTHAIGMVLDDDVDWNEVEVVVKESHRLLAPRPRPER